MEEKKKQMKTIELMTGNVLQCEKKKGRRKTWRKPKKPDNYATLMLFVRYAWFFRHNKELIYSDSKLFLAKLPIWVIEDGWYFVLDDQVARSELCKRNGWRQPVQATLGGMLEYWENRTLMRPIICDKKFNHELVYQFYRHSKIAHVIRRDGTTYRRQITDRDLSYNNAHIDIHKKYDEARKRCKAYTLDQVLDALLKAQCFCRIHEDIIKHEVLKLELSRQTGQNSRNSFLKTKSESEKEQLIDYIAYLRRDEIMPYYQKELDFYRNKPQQIQELEEEIREKQKELINCYNPGAQQELRELLIKKKDTYWSQFHDKGWEDFYGSDTPPSKVMERIKKYEQLSEAELKSHLIPELPDPEGNN